MEEYTAVVKRRGGWWIGRIEEIHGLNFQERTHEELRQSLAQDLSETLKSKRNDSIRANKQKSEE